MYNTRHALLVAYLAEPHGSAAHFARFATAYQLNRVIFGRIRRDSAEGCITFTSSCNMQWFMYGIGKTASQETFFLKIMP